GDHKALQNVHVEGNAPLKVQTVIGTSGGALLGYFVAQLGQKPLDLYGVLWGRGSSTLKSSDVFGATDMLRYLSIVFSIIVLCGWLSRFPPRETTARNVISRTRLFFALWPL